jgi:ribosomal protein S18 acetylase RimI-like enzyme
MAPRAGRLHGASEILWAALPSRRALSEAGAQGGERNEGCAVAEFVRCRAGWSCDVGESVGEGGQGRSVAFECGAFVVGEVELLEHLIDPVFDGQELAGVGLLGQVEAALGAGERRGEVVTTAARAGAGPVRMRGHARAPAVCSPDMPDDASMDIRVRRLRHDAEGEFVTGLEWLFAPPGSRPPDWDRDRAVARTERLLADENVALFAARSPQDQLVGVVSVYLDILSVRFGRRASIEDLAVHPEWRSQGVGASLLTTARAWAHERSADYVFLESGVARTEAHRFYLRHGATHAASAFRWTINHAR